jgi:hypothetical protein
VLFTQSITRTVAVLAIAAVLSVGFPSRAQSIGPPAQSVMEKETDTVAGTVKSKPISLAQATCASCGTELDSIAILATEGRSKNKSLLTDSLWGNLILEMAYQRDPALKKFARRMNIVNVGSMLSIAGIAGGTLAQGISALYVLNPPEGNRDSYAPLYVGVALSSATLLAFMARIYFNHKLEKEITTEQMRIKHRVESILSHLEKSDAKCVDAQNDLRSLIGERACHEWVQLWQSSHQIAMSTPQRISLLKTLGATK